MKCTEIFVKKRILSFKTAFFENSLLDFNQIDF